MINNSSKLLFNFMIFFVIIMLILEVVFLIIRKKEINDKKIGIAGILLELSDISILSISIVFIRFLFIIWSLFDNSPIIIIHLLILLILGLIYGFITKSIKSLVVESIGGIAIYFALVCLRILSGFLVDVRFEWYVLLGKICLITFVLLYSAFSLVKNISQVAVKNKYVRRVRNEDN